MDLGARRHQAAESVGRTEDHLPALSADAGIPDRLSHEDSRNQKKLTPQQLKWLFDSIDGLRTFDHDLSREAMALTVTGLIRERAEAEPESCLSLLNELTTLRNAYPADEGFDSWWARGIGAFIEQCAKTEPKGCLALLNLLATLRDTHPDDRLWRGEWAIGVVNFIGQSAAAEPKSCLSLLNEFTTLQSAFPDEPLLRAVWAESVFRFIISCAEAEPKHCQAMFETLATAVHEHPYEITLRLAHRNTERHLRRIQESRYLGARQNSDLVSEQNVQDVPVPMENTTPAGERGSPRPRSALPVPEAGHELTRPAESVAQSLAQAANIPIEAARGIVTATVNKPGEMTAASEKLLRPAKRFVSKADITDDDLNNPAVLRAHIDFANQHKDIDPGMLDEDQAYKLRKARLVRKYDIDRRHKLQHH